MPKTPPGSQPDPMLREVNRLLAQLAHTGSPPERDGVVPHSEGMAPRRITPTRSPAIVLSGHAPPPTRAASAALWARLLLGIVLGGVMLQWPYPHQCDLPLLGYLGAVATVMLTGAWIAFASWKLRSGLPHILSLILVFWGIVLAAEQLLPRIGYAADQASWRCPTELPVPNP
jgi:hypothetical protein